jgi:GH25 family lysozyme M1 (1,4-beta-N-acetylmuramidase)
VAPLEGLDVSRWQATIDWTQVKAAGKQFVVMKATQGTAYVDPMYATNRAGAMGVGIPMAAYHFADPDSSPGEAVAEADHYVAVAGLTPGNLLPALDLEQTGALAPAALQVWVRAWLDEVTAKLGIQPMIYVSPSFWSTKMGNNTSIAQAGYKVLWIANWGVTSPTVPANNWSGNGWTFWQYTDCGHVAGITTGCVDLDRFGGTDLTPVTYHPDFAVSVSPASQSVTRGSTTTFTVNVARTEFVPAVTLSLASTMPSGTTAVFSPNPVTGTSSTLTITTSNVPTVTPPGVVSPSIQGVGGGLTRTTLAKLTVLPALPDPPTSVQATALDASAYVTWTPPANDGGGTIASYQVTAAPGGKACSTKTGLYCTVSGLTNGTPYTFSVVATNETGPGATSAASAAVTPVASIPGATYFALSPARLVDSRAKKGLPHALQAGVASAFQVTGVGSDPVPADAVAVTGNLSVTGQTAPGYFALTSVATNAPKYSTLDFPLGDTRANGITMPLGSGGRLSLVYIGRKGATAQAIFDVTGYFLPGASGASYYPIASSRLVDSRSKTGLTAGPLTAGSSSTFQVTGVGANGIPAEATAVTGNLTVTGQTAPGYLALTSLPTAKPGTSTLNFPLGDTRANNVTIALGAGGKLSVIYMAAKGATAQVIFDVTGYFLPGSKGAAWFAVDPSRLVDSRSKLGLAGVVRAGTPVAFGATGQATNPVFNVPDGALGVTGNLTVTGQTAPGYLALTSVATAKPGSSTLNFPPGDTRANGVDATLGAGGKLWVVYIASKGATAQVIFDVSGYFLAGS